MKENNKTKIQTETEELTDEQLCEVLGGMGEYLGVLQEDKPETIDAAGAMTITAKTAGIDTQVSAICIGVTDKEAK